MNLNTEHRRMEDKSVTAFLLSPHYRTCRHLLLQIIVLLMTINVFWYEPLQSVSFWRRFGGFLAYFVSINTSNLYEPVYISTLFSVEEPLRSLCPGGCPDEFGSHRLPFNHPGITL